MKPADIHRQICEVYSENAMSDGTVTKCVRKFNEGHDNVHDEPRSGRPSVVSDDLVRAVEATVREDNGSPFRRCPYTYSTFQKLFSTKL